MPNNGYIKLHRTLQEWGWYKDQNVKGVFLHLLINARHTKGAWMGQQLLPGQLISGRNSLANDIGITAQNVRTALGKLKSTNEITIKSTKHYSLITIVNWAVYQGSSTIKSTNKSTINQPTTNQQLTTNKNDKNVKNEKKDKDIPFSRIQEGMQSIKDTLSKKGVIHDHS